MNQYKIYCTPSQTKKALELGAPLKTFIHVEPEFSMANGCLPYPEEIEMYEYPTTEQMIGWLEEHGNIWKINVDRCPVLQWYYAINSESSMSVRSNNLYSSRKEATLAAIDTALDYLSKNKK